MALICLGVWLNAADSLVTTTIMPSIGRQLGGYAYFSWATAAYMVGAILPARPPRASRRGSACRRAMVAAGLLTAVGCAISALAPGMLPLVAGRLVQGLGAGWIVGACYAALGSILPARHLARIFGMMTAVWGVATVLGPMVGAAFAGGGAGAGCSGPSPRSASRSWRRRSGCCRRTRRRPRIARRGRSWRWC